MQLPTKTKRNRFQVCSLFGVLRVPLLRGVRMAQGAQSGQNVD